MTTQASKCETFILYFFSVKPLVPIYFKDTSPILYDVNEMVKARDTYDSTKLYFEVTYSWTLRS